MCIRDRLVGLILICLNQIGVPTTSFVAAFGAFGLGIGLALQSNLSNLASGLLILIFKPCLLYTSTNTVPVAMVVVSMVASCANYTC